MGIFAIHILIEVSGLVNLGQCKSAERLKLVFYILICLVLLLEIGLAVYISLSDC